MHGLLLIDSVARFHLRNGACFYGINFMGNAHTEGLQQSAGLMANYMYITTDSSVIKGEEEWALLSVDDRALQFESSGGNIHCSLNVKKILDGDV